MYLAERFQPNSGDWEPICFVKEVYGVKRKIKRIFADKTDVTRYIKNTNKHYPNRLLKASKIDIEY